LQLNWYNLKVKIVVNNLLTNYRLEGQGKLILLLHGWGDSTLGLKALQSSLAKSYRVLSIDLPGFGESEIPKQPWALNDYADFVRDFLNKLDIGDLSGAVGHSNGGAVLIKAVANGAIKPAKLVLIAASGVRSGRSAKRIFLSVLAKTGNLATIWMPERYRDTLRISLYQAAGSDMLIVPELQETFKRTVREDIQNSAAKITIPTLLIYADQDNATPIGMGRTYNNLIKNSDLKIVTNSGHFIHLDQADQTLKLLEDFLR
jgi:pimeloyl-ACP methyl ester carboxylesterase